MLTWIREKFGTVVISSIISLIALVFIFSGVFSPKATRGLHEGAVAGKVNGDSISIAEFNRDLNRRIEFFRNMAGGKLTDDQIKGFRVKEMVFQELVRRRLLIQEAERTGMVVGDEQVKDMIREIPAFQKDGKFDVLTYKAVLEANQHTPGSFERLIREDASAQQWEDHFRKRVFVSTEEAKREFQASEEKRKIKYALLSVEAGRKAIQIGSAEIQKYLADATRMNLVKTQYEARKNVEFKDKNLDQAKEQIARDILAGEKLDEVQKNNEKLAEQIKGVLTAEKSSDAKVNALLKSLGVEVKTTEWLTRQGGFIHGAGDLSPVVKDAFSKEGITQAKKFVVSAGVVVALVTDSQKADFAQFEAKKSDMIRAIATRKQRDLFQGWMSELAKKAKIEPNPSVVSGEES